MSERRVFQVRRQQPHLTRFERVSAGTFEELCAGARAALGLAPGVELRVHDIGRCTDLRPGADVMKCGEELGIALAAEPRVSPARQKDVVAATKAAFEMLHDNACAGRFGFAEIAMDWRSEHSPSPTSLGRPLFCCALQLLSYPPHVDGSYPVDWQRLLALRFQDDLERKFVVHWSRQHVVMVVHPADFAPSAVRAGVTIAQLEQAEIDAAIAAIAELSGAAFWDLVCRISKANHPRGGVQDASFFSERMDPDYWPVFRGSSEPVSAVCNAITVLIRTGRAPDFSADWCRAHRDIFGTKTACLLNFMHYSSYANKPLWLSFICEQTKPLGLSIDDLGGACFLTPLAIAAKLGHVESVAACVDLGANVDAKTGCVAQRDYGATALFLAAREGRAEVCEYLVSKAHADVNALLEDGSSALAATRVPAIVKLLIDHGADVSMLVTQSNNMLWTGHEKDPALELMRLFLAAGAAKIVNCKAGYMEETPLSHICQTYGIRTEQALECARLLLAAGAHVNCTNKDGATPLQTLTAVSGAPDPDDLTERFVELLLDAGATWTTASGDGRSDEDGAKGCSPAERCIERGDWRSVVHFANHGFRLSKAQKKEVAARAPAEMAALIRRSEDLYTKARDQNMEKLLRELGETPSAHPKRRGAKKPKKPAPRQPGRGKHPDPQRKAHAQQQQEESDDEPSSPHRESIVVETQSNGPITIVAPSSAASTVAEASGNEDEWVEAGARRKKKQQQKKKKQKEEEESEKTKVPEHQVAATTTPTKAAAPGKPAVPSPQVRQRQCKPSSASPRPPPSPSKEAAGAPASTPPSLATSTAAAAAAGKQREEEEILRLRKSETVLAAQLAKERELTEQLGRKLEHQRALLAASSARIMELTSELSASRETASQLSTEVSMLRGELEQTRIEYKRATDRTPQQQQPQQQQPVSYGMLDIDRWLLAHSSSAQHVFTAFLEPLSQASPDESKK